MKTFRSKSGPFLEQPYFELDEIERICTDELEKEGFYPNKPEPIRIERFIEKRFKVSARYEDTPPGTLGYTKFGPKGVEAIIVSRSLESTQTTVSRRRMNTTLAHEAGHGLLHTASFVLAAANDVTPLFGGEFDTKAQRILCRDENISGGEQQTQRRNYDGRWWEVQANKAMGALLLPRELVVQCLETVLVTRGSFGEKWLEQNRREEAVRKIAEVFDVNPVVGRFRLQAIFPEGDGDQLTF